MSPQLGGDVDSSKKKILDFEELPADAPRRNIDWLKEWERNRSVEQQPTRDPEKEKVGRLELPISSGKLVEEGSSDKMQAVLGESKRKVSRRDRQATFEKPLIRMPPRSSLRSSPRQGALQLEPLPSQKDLEEEKTDGAVSHREQVSKEILFSRFLSGIIDLCLPVLTGFVFVFSASWILGFDFFMADSLEWAALISVFLFFLTSLFFLTTSQQTPGMYLTQLRIIRDGAEPETDPEDIRLSAILIRVLFFLPVALSGIGLVWGIFDPLRRCGHDFLSGTRIIPEDDSQRSG